MEESIALESNEKKCQRKVKESKRSPECFRATLENAGILRNVCNTTKFINNAITFYIMMLKDPIEIMKKLKKDYPNEWAYVNRKRF